MPQTHSIPPLLDSGATHPMRQAKDQREWDDALEVQVTLAGDNSTLMRLTQSGTLLLPPLERAGSAATHCANGEL